MLSPLRSRRRLPAVAAATFTLVFTFSACSSSSDNALSDNALSDEGAPTTLDASATVTPEAEAEVLATTTTTAVPVTTAPEPLEPDQEAAVREAVVAYHAAVAESFEPIDPENAALEAATTPDYFNKLSGLLQTLLASNRTADSDFAAEIISVSAMDEGVARVDLCEIDATVIYNADGSTISAAADGAPKASYLVLILNEAGEWRVDGGGLDNSDRACP